MLEQSHQMRLPPRLDGLSGRRVQACPPIQRQGHLPIDRNLLDRRIGHPTQTLLVDTSIWLAPPPRQSPIQTQHPQALPRPPTLPATHPGHHPHRLEPARRNRPDSAGTAVLTLRHSLHINNKRRSGIERDLPGASGGRIRGRPPVRSDVEDAAAAVASIKPWSNGPPRFQSPPLSFSFLPVYVPN